MRIILDESAHYLGEQLRLCCISAQLQARGGNSYKKEEKMIIKLPKLREAYPPKADEV